MNIIFLTGGSREGAMRFLLEKGENVLAVITPLLTPKNRRFEKVIETAAEFGVPIFPTRADGLMSVLRDFKKADILVSCGYPYIIKSEVINNFRYAINVHPTLLPKYRGFRSGSFILKNNEKTTGVTVHFITEEMDKGDILLQRNIDLTSFDTPRSMFRKTQEIEPHILYDAIQLLKSGSYRRFPQNEAEATEYRKILTPEDSRIDPSLPLIELYHKIRACDPEFYPAFFEFEGQKVCIKLWRPDRSPEDGEDTL